MRQARRKGTVIFSVLPQVVDHYGCYGVCFGAHFGISLSGSGREWTGAAVVHAGCLTIHPDPDLIAGGDLGSDRSRSLFADSNLRRAGSRSYGCDLP